MIEQQGRSVTVFFDVRCTGPSLNNLFGLVKNRSN